MSTQDRFSPRRPAESDDLSGAQAGEEARRGIDRESGEILEGGPREGSGTQRRSSHAGADRATVQGERAIPSVNRERSIQSRISSGLALAAIVLLGGGFLVWYYSTQFAKTREAEEAAKRATAARVSGEMKVPPLGRIEPPVPAAAGAGATSSSNILGPAPLPPQAAAPAAQAGPTQKTPAELALERKLNSPVLLRAESSEHAGAPAAQPAFAAAPGPLAGAPVQALMASALLGRGVGAEGQGASGHNLGALLKPTVTPAVAAEVTPNRRFLLPKGTFIDCTLETAIDSTYPGMATCIGAQDVYSADGKVVLLERGTKYIGEQKGEARLGQSRVFVLWSEARTPTGVVVKLDSPGTDELGRSGLPGYVDTHFWDRFGAAILISVIDGGLQALAAAQQNGGGTVVINPRGTTEIMTEVLKGTVAIPPTIVKNQGDRIQVLVARDVDFRPVYGLRSDDSTE